MAHEEIREAQNQPDRQYNETASILFFEAHGLANPAQRLSSGSRTRIEVAANDSVGTAPNLSTTDLASTVNKPLIANEPLTKEEIEKLLAQKWRL